MKKTVIFDFDDTLLDSGRPFVDTTKQAAQLSGIRVPEEKEIMDYGKNWDDFIAKTWPGINATNFKKIYHDLAVKVVYKTVPGANGALEALQEDYNMYILTLRDREFLQLRIDQSGLRSDLIKRIFTIEDVKHTKPDPRTFDELFQDMKNGDDKEINRNHVISIGDRLDDFYAAQSARINFAAVLSGYSTKDQFKQAGLSTDKMLSSVAQVPKYLEEIGF
ncbi:HAD family hydrolase [Candidatus Pacearchaeota archaeon]|nr:HAD family hydrolase [Candidatus Pacearchaeota archaeon]